ncbi:uncharacterized protein V6R79_022834 [Siganus canaliculatus]
MFGVHGEWTLLDANRVQMVWTQHAELSLKPDSGTRSHLPGMTQTPTIPTVTIPVPHSHKTEVGQEVAIEACDAYVTPERVGGRMGEVALLSVLTVPVTSARLRSQGKAVQLLALFLAAPRQTALNPSISSMGSKSSSCLRSPSAERAEGGKNVSLRNPSTHQFCLCGVSFSPAATPPPSELRTKQKQKQRLTEAAPHKRFSCRQLV